MIFNKKFNRIILSLALILTFISGGVFTMAADIGVQIAQPVQAQGDVGDPIAGGTVLHAFCWSFNTIKNNMQSIKGAGFTAVQTSPITECITYSPYCGSGNSLMSSNSGAWWMHYQPVSFQIGNHHLGTEAEFTDMCTVAKQYGVKVIVDAVVNHCASDENAIKAEIKNIPGGAFHTDLNSINNYNDRYQVTQRCLDGLKDFNTQNPNVQQAILNYLKKCVQLGASGFRYDAAKHIETPADSGFGSNFWPVILDNGAEFQYGETLQGEGFEAMYTPYMSVTASSYGGKIRNAIKGSDLSTYTWVDYGVTGSPPPNKLVTWVESHDNYCNEGSGSISDEQIRLGWAVLAGRADSVPLFFSRPYNSDSGNIWGNNVAGAVGNDNYKSVQVREANLFKNAMRGKNEYMSNPNNNTSLLMIERGDAGIMLVNMGYGEANLTDVNLNNVTAKMVNGTYTDKVSGGQFTVQNGKISGRVPQRNVVVLYNSDESDAPKIQANMESGIFWGYSAEVKVNVTNASTSSYKINNGTAISFNGQTSITVGSGMNDKDTVKITVTAQNQNGVTEKEIILQKRTINVPQGTTAVIFHDTGNWQSLYCYWYDDRATPLKSNGPWPGQQMTNLGDGYFMFILPQENDLQYVIFNNNNNGKQDPPQNKPGYEVLRGEIKIFDNGSIIDLLPEPPTTQMTDPTETTMTQPSQSTVPSSVNQTDPTEASSTQSSQSTEPSRTDPTETSPTQPSSTNQTNPTQPTQPSTVVTSGPRHEVGSAKARAGDTVTVTLSIKDNPGIISLRNQIIFDESALELTGVEDTGLLNGFRTPSPNISSPYTLLWMDSSSNVNNSANGVIAKLNFKIKSGTGPGDYNVSLKAIEALNVSNNNVNFANGQGKIMVIDFMLGDLDRNGKVNTWDAVLFERYLAGWNVSVDLLAADINGDGEVNTWDAILLERYLAGWDIEYFN